MATRATIAEIGTEAHGSILPEEIENRLGLDYFDMTNDCFLKRTFRSRFSCYMCSDLTIGTVDTILLSFFRTHYAFSHTLKLWPHPQEFLTFGLLNLKPDASKVSR